MSSGVICSSLGFCRTHLFVNARLLGKESALRTMAQTDLNDAAADAQTHTDWIVVVDEAFEPIGDVIIGRSIAIGSALHIEADDLVESNARARKRTGQLK